MVFRLTPGLILILLQLTTNFVFGQKVELRPGQVITEFIKKAESDSLYISNNYTHYEKEITVDFKDNVAVREKEEYYFVEKKIGSEKRGLYKTLVLLNGLKSEKPRVEFKEEFLSVSAKLLDRYHFTFRRKETVESVEYLVLHFRVKKNYPEEKKLDRVLNNIEGYVWISSRDYSFRKMTFRLSGRTQYYMPSFTGGTVKKVEGVVEAVLIEGRFAISFVRVEYRYSARAFFFPIEGHSQKTIYYQEYKRRQ